MAKKQSTVPAAPTTKELVKALATLNIETDEMLIKLRVCQQALAPGDTEETHDVYRLMDMALTDGALAASMKRAEDLVTAAEGLARG